MKPHAALTMALLALAGCSARNALPPETSFADPDASPLADTCQRVHNSFSWRDFRNIHKHLYILPPHQRWWARTAEVTNNMSNGAWVHVRGSHRNLRSYVEGHGGYGVLVWHDPGHAIGLRAIARPSSGEFNITIQFCNKEGR